MKGKFTVKIPLENVRVCATSTLWLNKAMSCISIWLTISGSTGCQFCECFLSGPLKPPPHFLLREREGPAANGATHSQHISLHPSDNLFSFCHMKIFQTYSKIHINIPKEDFTEHTHLSPRLTNQQSSQALLYNRCVSFCWRKQYSPPPMLILFPFLSCLFRNFPWICESVAPFISPANLCRITSNKLYETMWSKNKSLCSYF